MRMGKHRTFARTWASQTDLGKRFGMSAIAVGKVLIDNGLKDPATKRATDTALRDGWCVSTPLKTGEPHYMWHVEKVKQLLSKGHTPLSKAEQMANDLIATIKAAERDIEEGDDKLGYLALECAFDGVPKDLKEEVGRHLRRKGYGNYADGWLKCAPARKAGTHVL
jgi:hypothetical protein